MLIAKMWIMWLKQTNLLSKESSSGRNCNRKTFFKISPSPKIKRFTESGQTCSPDYLSINFVAKNQHHSSRENDSDVTLQNKMEKVRGIYALTFQKKGGKYLDDFTLRHVYQYFHIPVQRVEKKVVSTWTFVGSRLPSLASIFNFNRAEKSFIDFNPSEIFDDTVIFDYYYINNIWSP